MGEAEMKRSGQAGDKPVGASVLLVSEDTNLVSGAMRALTDLGHRVEVAMSLKEAATVAQEGYDLLIIDVLAPEAKSQRYLEETLELAGRGHTVALTGLQTLSVANELLERGVAHLALKPFNPVHIVKILDHVQSVAALQGETTALDVRLRRLISGMIAVMTRAIEAKHPRTAAHLRRTGDLAGIMAEQLPSGRKLSGLARIGGLVHDLGMIGISEELLDSGSKLTDEQWQHVRNHPVIGAEMIGQVDELKPVVPAVRSHHERLDGQGYPDGLGGAEIPLMGRIIAVSCAFDSMLTQTPYSPAMPLNDALMELKRCQGTQFDTDCVEALVEGVKEAGADRVKAMYSAGRTK